MRPSLSVLAVAILSVAVSSFGATTAPVPTLRITRHPERHIPPPDPKTMEAATREVCASLTEFRRVANTLRLAFESSPEYTTAFAAMINARSRLDLARQQNLVEVRRQPQYLQQAMNVEKLEGRLRATQREHNDREIASLAVQLMRERGVLSSLEADSLAADPSIAEKHQQYIDSASLVSALRENFAMSLRRNADWQEAQATYLTAVQRRASVR